MHRPAGPRLPHRPPQRRHRPPLRPVPQRRPPAIRRRRRQRAAPTPLRSRVHNRQRHMATLFASDLHLDSEAPWAIDAFLGFLAGPARGAEALYLLGDLFEVWVGDDDDSPDHARTCAGLKTLADSGVPVYVIHGNRDFLLGADFERRTGAKLLPDPVLVDLYGVPTL